MIPGPAGGERRWRRPFLVLPLALLGALFATTRVSCTGRLNGLYLLRAAGDGRPLELKDDLKLGEEERLLGGLDLGDDRWLSPPSARPPGLELQWDRSDGSGMLANRLPDGRTFKVAFGRFLHDDGREVHGLFVGGARPEVIRALDLDDSGVSVHDRDRWHHVWCTVNEAIRLEGDERVFHPADWHLTGSRVAVSTPEKVVLASEHWLGTGRARIAMLRHVQAQAGQAWFWLDVRYTNLGDVPVLLTYGYGDEPWVGRYGSADGNLGWVRAGLVPRATRLDPRAERWAGIVDAKSGLANFLAWQEPAPDLVYFNNHGGPPTLAETGAPLTSNEIYVGLEWQRRRLEPGGSLSVHLVVGLADTGPNGLPALPAGIIPGGPATESARR